MAPLASVRAADQTSFAETADPEQGAVEAGVYVNRYFGLSFPLPPGWGEGLAGPRPSESGYYVLGTFVPADSKTAGTVLIAAQDMFFAVKPADSALAAVEDTRRVVAATEGM